MSTNIPQPQRRSWRGWLLNTRELSEEVRELLPQVQPYPTARRIHKAYWAIYRQPEHGLPKNPIVKAYSNDELAACLRWLIADREVAA
jgi:hypothetical protein